MPYRKCGFRLTNSAQNPFVYPGCVNNLGVPDSRATRSATTFNNHYSTGLGPRMGMAYDLFGKHRPRFAPDTGFIMFGKTWEL